MNKQLTKGIYNAIKFLNRETPFYIFYMVMEILVTAVFCNIMLSVIMQKAVDAIGYSKKELLAEAVILAIVSLTISFLFKPLFGQKKNKCIRTVMANLRKEIFSMLLKTEVPSYEAMKQGDILLRMTKDVEKIEQIYLTHFHQLVFALIYGLTASILMLVYNPFLGSVAIGLGLLQSLVDTQLSKKINFFAKKEQKMHANMLQRIIELLEGFTDIQMSHHSSFFREKYQNANEAFVKQEEDLYKIKRLLNSVDNLFGESTYIGIMILGIWLISQSRTSAGSVMAVIGLQGNASYLFMNFSAFLSGLSEALPSIERVMEILDSNNTKENTYKKITLIPEKRQFLQKVNDTKPIIELKNLCFSYEPDKPVFKQLNLTIKQGDFVLITGESGCGKSTLYKLLLGFYQAKSGDYFLNGIKTENLSPEYILNQFAYLDQTSILFSMTVAENIALGKENASMTEIEDASEFAAAKKFIQKLPEGYHTILHDNADNISGGQRQRIAMARMYLSNRPILLIDEGTANIDEETENLVIENLLKLKRKKTIIMITHKKRIYPYADQIVTMKAEHIITSNR